MWVSLTKKHAPTDLKVLWFTKKNRLRIGLVAHGFDSLHFLFILDSFKWLLIRVIYSVGDLLKESKRCTKKKMVICSGFGLRWARCMFLIHWERTGSQDSFALDSNRDSSLVARVVCCWFEKKKNLTSQEIRLQWSFCKWQKYIS